MVVEVQQCVAPLFPVWAAADWRVDILSAALDAGTAIGTIFVFFWYALAVHHAWKLFSRLDSLQYPANGNVGQNSILSWWGNTVWMNTLDFNMTAFKTINATGRDHFG